MVSARPCSPVTDWEWRSWKLNVLARAHRNTQGTQNFQSRVHRFSITFTPKPNASVASPSPPNLVFNYKDTILFFGPDGLPTTGLDPTTTHTYPGFPVVPYTTFPGDGNGGPGPGGEGIPIDPEGLVLGDDGSFWVSDECELASWVRGYVVDWLIPDALNTLDGPFVYNFNSDGHMVAAIRPPEAIIPRRNGNVRFVCSTPDIPFLYLPASAH
jgi:hypothetical protein